MNTLQALVLVASGVGAFYAASDWSRGHAARSADDDLVVAAAPRPRAAAGLASAATAASALAPRRDELLAPRARSIPAAEGDAFGSESWQPPPPPPPPPAAPPPPPPPAPPPAAPPLPFSFVGLVEQGTAKPQAYLAKGDTLLIVAEGDVIDSNRYRVDKLLPAGVLLTYLPLGKQQTLNAPGAGP